ncbi:ATP-binding protein [Enterococcus asini]|uniref:ATP-binding protein n=1 Tax=Enterococcus asini TaxID=57732 RepID=UPI0032E4AA41
MLNVGKQAENALDLSLKKVGTCPKCGDDLVQFIQKNPDGTDRMPPMCRTCGHKEHSKKEAAEVAERYEKVTKQNTIDYFRGKSVCSDKEMFDCNFGNFKIVDQETKIAVNIAVSFTRAILNGNPKHLILTGKTGSGKSHIAMAIVRSYMKESDYSKRCLFINYRELLEMMKNAFLDDEARRRIHINLMREIKRAELVVIDDIGAELGGVTAGQSTTYNNDTLYSITEARQNKATIFTTNLTSEELQKSYGKRIISRMSKHSQGYTVYFKKTKDKRLLSLDEESGE